MSDATDQRDGKDDRKGPDHRQFAAIGDEFAYDGDFLDDRLKLRGRR